MSLVEEIPCIIIINSNLILFLLMECSIVWYSTVYVLYMPTSDD